MRQVHPFVRRLLPVMGSLLLIGTCAAATSGPAVAPVEAVTRPRFDAQIGFPLTGKVQSVTVHQGDEVKEGQELVHLDDAVLKAQIELLQLRATSELEVKAAQADLELALLQRQRIADSFKLSAASNVEMDRAAVETEKARLALELFRQRRQESELQVRETRTRIEQMTLRAPRGGVVDRIVTEVGEIVQEQRPVIRLVDIGWLRVETPIPTQRALSLKPGQPAWISYGLPGSGEPVRSGTILSLASVADAGSDTTMVRIEFENPDRSPAGRRVYVWVDQPQGAQGAVTPAPKTPSPAPTEPALAAPNPGSPKR